jgi:hypothetical protein
MVLRIHSPLFLSLLILSLLFLLLCALITIAQIPAAGQESVNWSRFSDPDEHAYSIDVPSGWKIQGGMLRRGPVDVSLYLRALSPDDSMILILGDPGRAYFGTPGLGAGAGARPYTPGQSYAREYVEQSLPEYCSALQFIGGNDRPDVASGPLAQATPYARHDAGDVTFSCLHNGKPTRAFMLAGTYLYASPLPRMPGSWGVNLLAGCLAPEPRVAAAKQLVTHMVLSAKLDPEWARRQQGYIDQATHNINVFSAAEQRAFDSKLADAKAQQAAMRGEYNAFHDVQTQTGTFVDPASGQRYSNVQNTQNYTWRNTGGQIRQTSGPTPPPGSGWTQLQQVPAQ